MDEEKLQKRLEKLIGVIIDQQVKCLDLQESVYIMQTLLAFTKLKPKLVHPYIRTITPMLKPDLNNPDEAPQLIAVCQIIELVTPFMNKTDKLVPAIIEDLRNLVYTQGTSVLNAALKCLVCFITDVTKEYQILIVLINKCYLLLKTQMAAKVDKNKLTSTFRALYMLGYLVKLHDFENMEYQGQPFMLDGNKVSIALFDIYEYFCNVRTANIRERALEGLSFLWVRYPVLLFRSEQMLKNTLQNCMQMSSKLNILIMLKEFLLSHDKYLTSSEQDTEQDEGSMLGVMQIYLKEVLVLGLDESLEVRKESISVIHLIWQHGHCNPAQLVPTLIALQCDKDSFIKESSYHILEKMYVKTSEIILVHLIEGMKLAQDFTMRAFNQFPEENAFTRLYSLLKQRKQIRNKFLLTIVQQLDPMKPEKPEVFEFLAAVLANCQFLINEELQIISQFLSQKVDAQTAIIKQKLKQIIKNTESEEKQFEEVQEACLICILLTLRKYLFMIYSFGGYDVDTKSFPSDKHLNKFPEMQTSFISCCEKIKPYYKKQMLFDQEIVTIKDLIKSLSKVDLDQINMFMARGKRPRRGGFINGENLITSENPQKKQETEEKKQEMGQLNGQKENIPDQPTENKTEQVNGLEGEKEEIKMNGVSHKEQEEIILIE